MPFVVLHIRHCIVGLRHRDPAPPEMARSSSGDRIAVASVFFSGFGFGFAFARAVGSTFRGSSERGALGNLMAHSVNASGDIVEAAT